MLKRFGSGKIDENPFDSEDVNPMAGVSNLADAMLVLAVGIMLALVINWKIDVGSNSVSEVNQDDLTEISDYESISDDEITDITTKSGLEQKGTVYVDPETGKMYVIVSEDE